MCRPQPWPPGGVKTSSETERSWSQGDDGPLLQSSAANTRDTGDTGDWGDQVSPGDRWSVQTYLAPALAAWVAGHQTVLFNYVKKIIRWAPPVSPVAHYTLGAVSSLSSPSCFALKCLKLGFNLSDGGWDLRLERPIVVRSPVSEVTCEPGTKFL